MIISVDITEQDVKRLNELKIATESATRSSVIREAIRFYHKFFLQNPLSTDSKNHPSAENLNLNLSYKN